ncbi:Hsp20/alpha crystallin family protein, partial [Cloacibacillus evryensis]
CSRTFYVGENAKPEDVKAKFEDGILTVSLPKEEPKKLPAKNNLIAIEG